MDVEVQSSGRLESSGQHKYTSFCRIVMTVMFLVVYRCNK